MLAAGVMELAGSTDSLDRVVMRHPLVLPDRVMEGAGVVEVDKTLAPLVLPDLCVFGFLGKG